MRFRPARGSRRGATPRSSAGVPSSAVPVRGEPQRRSEPAQLPLRGQAPIEAREHAAAGGRLAHMPRTNALWSILYAVQFVPNTPSMEVDLHSIVAGLGSRRTARNAIERFHSLTAVGTVASRLLILKTRCRMSRQAAIQSGNGGTNAHFDLARSGPGPARQVRCREPQVPRGPDPRPEERPREAVRQADREVRNGEGGRRDRETRCTSSFRMSRARASCRTPTWRRWPAASPTSTPSTAATARSTASTRSRCRRPPADRRPPRVGRPRGPARGRRAPTRLPAFFLSTDVAGTITDVPPLVKARIVERAATLDERIAASSTDGAAPPDRLAALRPLDPGVLGRGPGGLPASARAGMGSTWPGRSPQSAARYASAPLPTGCLDRPFRGGSRGGSRLARAGRSARAAVRRAVAAGRARRARRAAATSRPRPRDSRARALTDAREAAVAGGLEPRRAGGLRTLPSRARF